MTSKHSIELVDPRDPNYRLHERMAARKTRESKHFITLDGNSSLSGFGKNELDNDLRREYLLWESLLRKILILYVKEFKKRILRYQETNGKCRYREIDFIVEFDDSLIFCEIKHRKKINTDIFSKARRQVEKSHRIAKTEYRLMRPLVLVVDMSFALDIKYEDQDEQPKYEKIRNLENFFKTSEGEADLIYFNSAEIIKIVLEQNLASRERLSKIKSIYDKVQNEIERDDINFTADSEEKLNNPFEALKNQINFDKNEP